jgi:hypothetical protein
MSREERNRRKRVEKSLKHFFHLTFFSPSLLILIDKKKSRRPQQQQQQQKMRPKFTHIKKLFRFGASLNAEHKREKKRARECDEE